ncbi:MAG TPA: hypothetical protein PKY59_11825 [Pyrinomonadaceae bacterium]|nr:hypothetical protein [Pyrinomonadaceae bacterium]
MKPYFKTKLFYLAVLLMCLCSVSQAQGIGSGSMTPKKATDKFNHIDCGFRFPTPGTFTLSTSVGYSPFASLGQGMINRFSSDAATFDIGCIDADDPPRKMPRTQLVTTLVSMTKTYLQDPTEPKPLASSVLKEKEIYEFETKQTFFRRIKYIIEGNRISIFVAASVDEQKLAEALKLFDAVEHFSLKENVKETIASATQKTITQTPALTFPQSDAARNNLKGRVKNVRRESEDVAALTKNAERKILADETYDRTGNLLKDFWFQDSGYPTSVSVYGFVNGARVSDSEEIGYDTVLTLSIGGVNTEKLPPPDTRFENRYEYKFDAAKRLIKTTEYDNRGRLNAVYTYEFKAGNIMLEKWFNAEGKLNSTKRRKLDNKGNELTYEFWWYQQTDKETEAYEYKKFDSFGNWTERRVVKTIVERGLKRIRTSDEFRTITYYQ